MSNAMGRKQRIKAFSSPNMESIKELTVMKLIDENLRKKMGEEFENGNNAVAIELSQVPDEKIVQFIQQDSQTSSS